MITPVTSSYIISHRITYSTSNFCGAFIHSCTFQSYIYIYRIECHTIRTNTMDDYGIIWTYFHDLLNLVWIMLCWSTRLDNFVSIFPQTVGHGSYWIYACLQGCSEHSLLILHQLSQFQNLWHKCYMMLDAKIPLKAALSSIVACPLRRAVVAVDTDFVDLRVSGSPESLRPWHGQGVAPFAA